MNKFFMGVRIERSVIPSVDTSSVTATGIENPFSNDVTLPTSSSTISVDCTEQESIPDASTSINQNPTPKQDKLNVAIRFKKDTLLLLHKKRDKGHSRR